MINSNKTIKIVLTGGGTAGHIWPVIAVVEELRKLNKNLDFLFISSSFNNDEQIIDKYNLNYKAIHSGKVRRYFDWNNFIDPFKVIKGFFQAIKILKKNQPNVIFAKGGYTTFPVVLAGWLLKIPIIIHESDSIMGLANKMEAKLAKRVCVGFSENYYPNISRQKIVYTGNPVRSEFIQAKRSNDSNRRSNTILITGGSQGAHFINQTILAILPKLTKKYHVIHICGKSDYTECKKNTFSHYELYNFTDKIPELMKRANLIITRAGAGTLAEISSLSKPAIIIPLPTSANNHQAQNAQVYKEHKAAAVIIEQNIIPDNLRIIIEGLLNNKSLLKVMSINSYKLFKKDAAALIAREILKLTSIYKI